MPTFAERIKEKPCGCRYYGPTGWPTHLCSSHEPSFEDVVITPFPVLEVDIDKLREQLAEEKQLRAEITNAFKASLALLCPWKPQGQCLIDCPGSMVCKCADLTLVDDYGEPVGQSGEKKSHAKPPSRKGRSL